MLIYCHIYVGVIVTLSYIEVLSVCFLFVEKQGSKTKNGGNENQAGSKSEPTWVEDLFQGTFTNETRCLNCETVSCVSDKGEQYCHI